MGSSGIMTEHESYYTTGIIVSSSIQIKFNGEPSTVRFLVDINSDDVIGHGKMATYIGLLEDYSRTFTHGCMGQEVEILLEPFYENEIFQGYKISDLRQPDGFEDEEELLL